TGVNSDNRQQACLATSEDDLIVWKKYEGNPIIAMPPDEFEVLGFRDHSLWQEDGFWYQIIGSGIAGIGGTVLLYRSQDLYHWEYLHPLLTGDKNAYEPLWTGMMWECPQFFKLGDKHVLIISVQDDKRGQYTAYFTGQYHDQRFYPETLQKLDYGNMNFYAPQMCFDAQGRALLWGWLPESRSVEAQIAAGWSGVMSLPRILEMRTDGRLDMRPAPEIEGLRSQHTRYVKADLLNAEGFLPSIPGRAIELYAIFEGTDSGTCGIRLSSSPNAEEYVHIIYDFQRKRLGMKLMQAAVNGGQPMIYEGELLLSEAEPLKLRIFLDYSVIEVYANERQCITGRFYPAQTDKLSIQATSEAGISLTSIDIWKLEPIWDV
ncbi:MAG TPA: glycoside hydrolase family 32 protein, partial [Terriglobales bacterium]|nr:glycoside hydrolase family 32 protein [Terriglobales bacterium]